ncbi:MAG TPA: serine--tRNA ligase [Stellaceae bacterium]|jgi:seryl-tRNA synthetase|nr:serine--tRNA ligase [Stellaceae bacterium]
MFDLKTIRDDPDSFDRGLARRGLPPRAPEILALDKEWRAAQTAAEQLQAERNKLAREIGGVKAKGGDAVELMRRVAESKDEGARLEAEASRLKAEIDTLLAGIPNIPLDDVPDGKDEHDNKLVRMHGTPRKFAFAPKDHVTLGESLRQMDFARAGKLSGARFVLLSGGLARLERALAAFMLDLHTNEFGYTEIAPPLLVRDETAYGTGQLPKFADDLFRTTTGLWLIPTAEVPLTNLVAGEILDEAALPLRFTAWTPCFRSEAGAAGKDTRGMIRLHQFDKVELVSIAHPDRATEEHERMTACAEEVLKRLDLPYRVMLLATGDMGAAARKTYDIEVWLPGQNAYREISSCSQCGEYQARRMNARFKPKEGSKKGGGGNRFVHTLNGSGLAVGRALVAVLENHQQEDGSITVPLALRPYMGGVEVLRRDG